MKSITNIDNDSNDFNCFGKCTQKVSNRQLAALPANKKNLLFSLGTCSALLFTYTPVSRLETQADLPYSQPKKHKDAGWSRFRKDCPRELWFGQSSPRLVQPDQTHLFFETELIKNNLANLPQMKLVWYAHCQRNALCLQIGNTS